MNLLFNAASAALFDSMLLREDELRIESSRIGRDIVFDFGVTCPGTSAAGIELAKLCMGNAATIELVTLPFLGGSAAVQVSTAQPVAACLGCQYAGWPIKADKYFAMASGPMRLCRGREPVLEKLQLHESPTIGVVGVLESDKLPTAEVLGMIRDQCRLGEQPIRLVVAPTTSIAGAIQVVARSVETAMHKLEEIGFDVQCVLSGSGSAPIPPPSSDTIAAIGRTNDAILYGGSVTLRVDVEPEMIDRLGPQVPSSSSRDYGRPFAAMFADYGYDFYKIDPLLFSPAEITFVNLRDGSSKVFGKLAPEMLAECFS